MAAKFLLEGGEFESELVSRRKSVGRTLKLQLYKYTIEYQWQASPHHLDDVVNGRKTNEKS